MFHSKLHIRICAAAFILMAVFGASGAGATRATLLHEAFNSRLKGDPKLVVGQLSDVGSSWQTVLLPHTYAKMVVVASPVYTSAQAPAVVRIRNATGNTFEVRVQNPSGQTLAGYAVQYLAVEEGVYTQHEHGITMEAALVASKETNFAGFWSAEPAVFKNVYNNPVVSGQVMTFNDERWSVFWSHGVLATTPPGIGFFNVGKHVGEDPGNVRGEETLGYVVFESGAGALDGYVIEAYVGEDAVIGMDAEQPTLYPHNLSGEGYAIVSQAGMDGGNGSWAVLWGDDPLQPGVLQLAVDEDQLLDDERIHSTEQVSVLIFNIVQKAPQLLSFSPDTGVVGDPIILYGNYFTAAQEVLFNGVSASFTVLSDQQIEAVVPAGASSGTISVIAPGGTGSSISPFVVLNAPQIFSFQPEEGPRGTVVEITGQNFVALADVSFGGWSSPSYEVISDTKILATVPSTSNTGRIRVRNAAGMATTPEVFRVLSIAAVDDIIPNRAEASSTITILGAGFLEVESVEFSDGISAAFTVISDDKIQVTVPANGGSGPVNVVFDDGTKLQGPVDFTVTFAWPLQGLNLCRLTAATMAQSSVNQAFAGPGKACDGITNGTLEDKSFTDTQSEAEPWWETDLGGVYQISEVAVWNRTDCCKDALSNFYIFLSDTPFPSKSVAATLSDGAIQSYFVPQVDVFESVDIAGSGRYIRVQKQGVGALMLAEVEIVSAAGNVLTSEDDDLMTEELMLDGAFPSPFQSQTTISYHLARTARIRLSVFDVLGREVRVLQDTILPAGDHQAIFSAENLPAGVYFYHLFSEGKRLTNTVVLRR